MPNTALQFIGIYAEHLFGGLCEAAQEGKLGLKTRAKLLAGGGRQDVGLRGCGVDRMWGWQECMYVYPEAPEAPEAPEGPEAGR